MRLIFATHNAHKVEEVNKILAESGIELVPLSAIGFTVDPPEEQDTFEGNALQKAKFVYEKTGEACVADDSGIEVDALHGAPGVHSKRFSLEGTDNANNKLLLEKLVDQADRTARYRCVIAVVGLGEDLIASGSCEGQIGETPRGDGGFGYDPLFWPDEAPGRTMAELTMAEKNKISHRGRAFRKLPGVLEAAGHQPSSH